MMLERQSGRESHKFQFVDAPVSKKTRKIYFEIPDHFHVIHRIIVRVRMFIKKLDYERYKGQKYQAEILSDRYLSIDPVEEGFDIGWVMSDEPLRMSINVSDLWKVSSRSGTTDTGSPISVCLIMPTGEAESV